MSNLWLGLFVCVCFLHDVGNCFTIYDYSSRYIQHSYRWPDIHEPSLRSGDRLKALRPLLVPSNKKSVDGELWYGLE